MNRATKNKLRGEQRRDIPDIPDVGYPFLLAQYNDRGNFEAGTVDVRAVKPLQPDGLIASWIGSTPPN